MPKYEWNYKKNENLSKWSLTYSSHFLNLVPSRNLFFQTSKSCKIVYIFPPMVPSSKYQMFNLEFSALIMGCMNRLKLLVQGAHLVDNQWPSLLINLPTRNTFCSLYIDYFALKAFFKSTYKMTSTVFSFQYSELWLFYHIF